MKGMVSTGILLMDGDGKGRERGNEGRERRDEEEGREKEERGGACPTNEKSFSSPTHRHCLMPHGSNFSSAS